jgi:hypothetical protein
MRVTLQGSVSGRAGSAARYEVTAISAGVGNGLTYPAGVLEAALPLFEGVAVFVDHGQLGELFSQTGGRSVRNVLGVLEHVYYTEGLAVGSSPAKYAGCSSDPAKGAGCSSDPAKYAGCSSERLAGEATSPQAALLSKDAGEVGRICGELRVYPGPDAEWFTAMVDQHLIDRSEARASPQIGLSAVLDVLAQGQEVVSIAKVVSVDAVFDPARGGEFVRALNQRREEMPEEVVGSRQ